jgi:ketosteroid isomerase-like protein
MGQARHNWGETPRRRRSYRMGGCRGELLLPAAAGPKEDLLAADKAFSDMSVAKGSDAAFIFYLAEDGRLFGVGSEPPIHGKAAAAKRFAERGNGAPAIKILSWSPEHGGLFDDGTAGWTDGVWTFAGAPDAKGARAKLTGRYLTVRRKNANGRWKVEADIGTKDSAPPSSP